MMSDSPQSIHYLVSLTGNSAVGLKTGLEKSGDFDFFRDHDHSVEAGVLSIREARRLVSFRLTIGEDRCQIHAEMHPVSTTLVATLFTLLRSVDLEEYDQVCMDYSRDCERRADLCYTKVDLMHRSCPKTCQVCTAAAAAAAAAAQAPPTSGALTPPTVVGPPTSSLWRSYAPPSTMERPKKEPAPERPSVSSKSRRPSKKCRDIASDCDETADLCDHASFKKMMKKQCAKTCGFCHPGRPSSSSSSKSGGSSGGGGEGEVLTISGLAGEVGGDLPKRSSTKGTKKTVDGLSLSELVKLIRKAEETTETQTCADMAYDCPIKQGLCGNARYSKLMLKMCMRTCNLCTTSSTTT